MSRWLRYAAGLAAAFGMGAVVGWSVAGPAPVALPSLPQEGAHDQALPPAVPRVAPVLAGSPEGGDCICGTERRVLESMLSRARRDAYGEPMMWPPDAGIHAPSVVSEVLQRVASECGSPSSLLDIDCLEPPCIGTFVLETADTSAAFRIQTCSDWKESYGGNASVSLQGVDCGDRHLRLMLISPPWPAAELSPDVGEEAATRRLEERWREISQVACDSVGSEPPKN